MSTEQPADDNDDLRYFVRVGQTDLDGTKTVERALLELTGIGRRATRVVAAEVGVDLTDTLGLLEDDEIDELVETIESFADIAPDWMANHRNEFFSGETTHRIGNDLELTRRQDINRMKMIDSYKGIRHEKGQKVRGQRTKSTGRTEGTIGVNIEEIKEEREAEAAEGDEDDGGL
jgi:small subunit ribosomal protein S13